MTRLPFCLTAGVLCAALLTIASREVHTRALSAEQPAVPSNIVLGDEPIEREITRPETHHYTIALTAGQYASLAVEQRGIDLIVQVHAPDDGRVVGDFDDEVRPAGEERVEIVAVTAGSFTIDVQPGPGRIELGAYAIRVLERRMASSADRAIQESRALRATASRLERTGGFEYARPLFERALQIAEDARGADDPYVTALVTELAGNALELRDNVKARALYERALEALDRRVGIEHPRSAMVRSRLGLLFQRAGQRPKAETQIRQAAATIERTLGTDHPWFVRCLVTLATLRDDAGDIDEAELIDRRGLSIVERIDLGDTILEADLLNNLGDIYRQKGEYDRAQDYLQRSLAIGERLRGPQSYYVATSLQNLGIVARERKDYATAEADYERALAIREALVGPNHPDAAQLLNNLANIYNAKGDHMRSLDTHFRALSIWEHSAGPYERGMLLSVGNIARTYASAGDIPNAIRFQRRADGILEAQLSLNLAIGSERQKLIVVSNAAERTDRTLSLHLAEAAANPEAAKLAALVLLQRKGRVQDAMADTLAMVRKRTTDAKDQALLDQLKTTTAELARLALSMVQEGDPNDRQGAIRELDARKEQLEAELSERNAAFRAQARPVTLEAVQAAIPTDTALLEFAVYRPFDPRAERNAEAYGTAHYAVYVLRKEGVPAGIDLGEATTIDERVEALRERLRDPRRPDVKEKARAVEELVLHPLRRALGDAKRLLISPDGALSLVPFEALVDEQGRYLIERYAMSYLTSGRDLLRMQVPHAAGGLPVIFADPLFGDPAPPGGDRSVAKYASAQVPRRSVTTGADLSTVYFAPLGATSEEAREIKALFPEATLLTGRRATKAALQQVEAPRLLHIASHGFFLRDTGSSDAPATQTASATGTRTLAAGVASPNPLLRSGLAFAGANLARDGQNDGILTALEASNLNLWGTRLVTLSACDTGVGEVRNGEGVYGLRRAFVLAGTETLVMSLWPVNDYIARETMVAYYTGLRAGLGRGDALRQAKLEMLKRRVRQHPFYWASFIQSGEWGKLD